MVRDEVLLAARLLCGLVGLWIRGRLTRKHGDSHHPSNQSTPISQSPPPHSYMWALQLASVVADPRTALHEYFPRGRFAAPPQRASLLADPFTLDDFLVGSMQCFDKEGDRERETQLYSCLPFSHLFL